MSCLVRKTIVRPDRMLVFCNLMNSFDVSVSLCARSRVTCGVLTDSAGNRFMTASHRAQAFSTSKRASGHCPNAATDATRLDDEAVRTILGHAGREGSRLGVCYEGERPSGWKTVESFTDQIGTVPNGKTPKVDFGRLYHSRHVLAGPSALLP